MSTNLLIKFLISSCLGFFFLLTSCTQHHAPLPLSAKEHASLEALFSHFLFQEGGIYTLFGDKPMSFDISPERTPEEQEELLNQNLHPILRNAWYFLENWETWERVKGRFTGSPFFLLCKRPSPSFSLSAFSVFLVNVPSTIATLHAHYDKFRKVIGYDFDPMNIVFELEDDHSIFWQDVLSSHYLVGILFGYGELNAWFFEQMQDYRDKEIDFQKRTFFTAFSKNTPASNALEDFDISFPLPSFGCFAKQQSRELLKKYERDRKRIRKIYKGKDLVTVTLGRLSSQEFTFNPTTQYRNKTAKILGIEDAAMQLK